MAVMRLLIATVLVVASAGAAPAQSPLVADLRAVEARYHEDPTRLDRLYQGLTEALKTDSHLDNFLALAQISYMWGDVRARTP